MTALLTSPRRLLIGGIVLLLVAAVALTAGRSLLADDSQEVVANMPSAPGLYEGNKVTILGVDTGTISKVVSKGGYVQVHMSVPADVELPRDVHAIAVSPRPVSDRTIELAPAYVEGPRWKEGEVIPLARTSAPMPVDEIFDQVHRLSEALGPRGANQTGSLSGLVETAARLTEGNGQAFRELITSLSQSTPTLSATADQMKQLLADLDTITQTLADNDRTVGQLFTNLDEVTASFAAERQTLARTLADLRSATQTTADFLRANRATISGSTRNLATVAESMSKDLASVEDTFKNVDLGFANFADVIDPKAPCVDGSTGATCGVAFGRIDLAQGVDSRMIETYCESAAALVLPIIVGSVPGLGDILALLGGGGSGPVRGADTVDSMCLANRAVAQGHDGSPGAPGVPNLQLARFLD